MFCQECGCENEDNAKFCCQCGALLDDTEDGEQEEENNEAWGIARFAVAAFVVIVIVFIYLCFQSGKQDDRQELYTFYIMDSAGGELMSGGIKRAEVVGTEDGETGETAYGVEIEFTDDAAAVFGYITEQEMGEQISCYLDERMLITATVNGVIENGKIYVPASSKEDAEELAVKLENTAQ